MIKINIDSCGGDRDGVCTYRLTIYDRDLIVFPHDSSKGVADLLRTAADRFEKILSVQP